MASGVFSRFLYRVDMVGRYSECGVGFLETVSSNSRCSLGFPSVDEDVDIVLEYGEVGEMTSSCQVFLGAVVVPCFGLMGPVGVKIVDEAGIDDCETF